MHDKSELLLAADICSLMSKREVPNDVGITAIIIALIISLSDSYVEKEHALEMIGECWDELEPKFKRALVKVRSHA
jgi:hypothetical protein